MRSRTPGMTSEIVRRPADASSTDQEPSGGQDDPRSRARAISRQLREIEQQAEDLGGRELFLVVSCAREVLERRWGRYDD